MLLLQFTKLFDVVNYWIDTYANDAAVNECSKKNSQQFKKLLWKYTLQFLKCRENINEYKIKLH